MSEPYWASGPNEVLLLGASLLVNDSDANRRLSIICIDNAVELMMHTFINLPKRVTGVELTRKQREDFCNNFPSLVDGMEIHAKKNLDGFDFGQIEWFHRLRNQLYHDGNGLTIERTKAELYLQLALEFFERISGFRPDVGKGVSSKLTSNFVSQYLRARREVGRIMEPDIGTLKRKKGDTIIVSGLGSETMSDVGKVEMLWFRFSQKGDDISSEKVEEMRFLADKLQRVKK